MSIRKYMNIITETKLNEFLGFGTDQVFGIRTTKKQSDQFPNSADTLRNDFEDNSNDWGQRYNFSRYMPDIENHPDFVRLVRAFETDEDGNSRYSQRQEFDMCKGMARDLNHTTAQIWDYCSMGPWYRRDGHLDFDKYSPTDGALSPYFDRNPNDRRKP
jgi:hypothetical protein